MPAAAQTPPAAPSWIDVSNNYTNMLLAVQMKHSRKPARKKGLSEFDAKVSQPTLANEDQERKDRSGAAQTARRRGEQQQEEAEDLQIMIRGSTSIQAAGFPASPRSAVHQCESGRFRRTASCSMSRHQLIAGRRQSSHT